MKGLICYFSTTGNTKLACEHINSKIDKIEFDYYDITSSNEPNFSDYELFGFATFTDYFEPGKLMVRYMESIKGDGKPAFVFNTYGQMSGNTLGSMARAIKESGFKLIEAYSLHVPENYPPLIKNGTTNENYPTDKELESFNEFMTNLNGIAEKLIKGQVVSEKTVKRRVFFSIAKKLMSSMNMEEMGVKKVHKDRCTSCGICSKVCPYDAIEMIDGYPVFDESKCESCYACFNNCPTKSIYTKKLDGIGHYAKPHTKLVQKMK